MVVRVFRLVIPAVWIGLLIGLAFIETPLKFLAPGMTLELALGLGRIVLTAADIAGAALLVVMTAFSLARPRVTRGPLVTLGSLWVVLLAQIALIRPALNHRTDVVLAGGDPGSSPLHVLYIVADVVLLAGLVVFIALVARADADARRFDGRPRQVETM